MTTTDRITLRLLRCFVTLAEELHFRRAAERLHISQPPLTQRIQDMERELGVELFRRLGHRVELTDAGRAVLKSARDTLAQVDGLYEVAQRAARGEYGQIRIGLTITALFCGSVHQAFRTFQREHPHLSLDLTYVSSGRALDALRRCKRDVCLVRELPAPVPPDCLEIMVAREKLMLVLPAGHPHAKGDRIPLSAVVDDRFIALTPNQGIALHSQITRLWEKSGLQPRVAQEAENGPTAMALVAGGLGYTILPSSFQTIRFESLIWKAIDGDASWTETSLNLVCFKDALLNPVVRSEEH